MSRSQSISIIPQTTIVSRYVYTRIMELLEVTIWLRLWTHLGNNSGIQSIVEKRGSDPTECLADESTGMPILSIVKMRKDGRQDIYRKMVSVEGRPKTSGWCSMRTDKSQCLARHGYGDETYMWERKERVINTSVLPAMRVLSENVVRAHRVFLIRLTGVIAF